MGKKGRNLYAYGKLIKNFDIYYVDYEDELNTLLEDFTEFVNKYKDRIKFPSIKDLDPDIQQAAAMLGLTDENLFEPENKEEIEKAREEVKAETESPKIEPRYEIVIEEIEK